jgi:hypothetical protein
VMSETLIPLAKLLTTSARVRRCSSRSAMFGTAEAKLMGINENKNSGESIAIKNYTFVEDSRRMGLEVETGVIANSRRVSTSSLRKGKVDGWMQFSFCSLHGAFYVLLPIT